MPVRMFHAIQWSTLVDRQVMRDAQRLIILGLSAAAMGIYPGLIAAQVSSSALHSSTTVSGHFVNNLLPQPSSVAVGDGIFALTSTFAVETPGVHDSRLMGAIERATSQMETTTGLPHAGTGVTPATRLVVNVRRPGEVVQSLDEDETYSLKVTPRMAEIDAATDVGAMRGLATLVQLIQVNASNNGYIIPAVTIEDSPRFRWRGLMIDCGRHFEPIEVLKRNIDAMAAVKLNVFHWHLTEDQGFRIQSRRYPKLTELGSDGNFYTHEQAKDLVAYAYERGIRVVPEFEMPGHSVAWLVAYPQLASGKLPAGGIRREFGVSDAALDPTNEKTYVFLQKFLAEMATIFPDAYFHIGGDETPAPDWKTNPKIIAFMKDHAFADNAALQAYFNTRVLKILGGLHKHMVGWDEIMNPSLPRDIIVQSWRGIPALAEGAKMGFQGILSAGYYLDFMQSAGVSYLVDPLPADTDMTSEQQSLVLGGEMPSWGEHVWSRTIDSRIWPRTAAIAERFWSPRDVRDVDDMYRRLAVVSIQLEQIGVTHLQSEDAGLRELIGTTQIDTLRTFASVFEPVPFDERVSTQHTDQLTSLDLFVDAVRPDPPSKHWSETAIRDLIANPSDALNCMALDKFFSDVAATIPEVRREIAASPRLRVVFPPRLTGSGANVVPAPNQNGLQEVDTLSTRVDQLAQLTKIGHEALVYIAEGTRSLTEHIGDVDVFECVQRRLPLLLY